MHVSREGEPNEFRDMMFTQVDSMIRQAVQSCWMALPAEKRSIDAVETEIRRVVDRALENLREDAAAFGIEE